MKLEQQTYKTQIGKEQLKAIAKRLSFDSVGQLINTAVIGLVQSNGIKLTKAPAPGENPQLLLFVERPAKKAKPPTKRPLRRGSG